MLWRFGIDAPWLFHREGEATWPMLRQAVNSGALVRIGLEDTLALPDDREAPSNEFLVIAARRIAKV